MIDMDDGRGVDWDGQSERRRNLLAGMNDITILSARLQSLHSDVTEIKGAMKELATAITKLAIIEERQSLAVAAQERVFKAMAEFETRVRTLELLAPGNTQTHIWVERAVLVTAGAAILFAWSHITRGG